VEKTTEPREIAAKNVDGGAEGEYKPPPLTRTSRERESGTRDLLPVDVAPLPPNAAAADDEKAPVFVDL
jgi:hypothetical protein